MGDVVNWSDSANWSSRANGSTSAERRYVVRLSVHAAQHESADAVHELLDRLLAAGLAQFEYSVDEVGPGVRFFVTPADYRTFIAALDRVWELTGSAPGQGTR